MTPLVFLEERDGVITRDSLGVLSHVSAQFPNVAALAMPAAWHDDAAVIGAIGACGATRLYVASGQALADHPIEPRAAMLVSLCAKRGIDTLVFAGSSLATDLAGRVAGLLDAGIVWNATALELGQEPPCARRTVMADTFVAPVEWRTPVRIALMRQRAFEPKEHGGISPEVVELPLPEASGVRVIRVEPRVSAARLGRAEIVVSAGRGIGKRENMVLVEELATALGGAVGVSLPLVEAGWAPRSMQVGQTGIIVQPRLYVACGISGQFQHRLGMERSETIVAINSDSSAPIMGFCDIAVVGDVKAIVPRLTELIRARALSRSKAVAADEQ